MKNPKLLSISVVQCLQWRPIKMMERRKQRTEGKYDTVSIGDQNHGYTASRKKVRERHSLSLYKTRCATKFCDTSIMIGCAWEFCASFGWYLSVVTFSQRWIYNTYIRWPCCTSFVSRYDHMIHRYILERERKTFSHFEQWIKCIKTVPKSFKGRTCLS